MMSPSPFPPSLDQVLMKAMESVTGKRPVGPDAPLDLAGVSPAGCASFARVDVPKNRDNVKKMAQYEAGVRH